MALGLIFRLEQPSQRPSLSVPRSPQRLLASAVAVQFIPCVTLATQGASLNIQSLVFCDTANNQQHHGEIQQRGVQTKLPDFREGVSLLIED